jgi:hypothetical protein
VESGGKITIPEATMLTVNGGFEAGLSSIFTFVSAGTSRLVFNSNTLDSILPQWFGATADGVHDDSPAIQRAIDIAAFSVAKQIKMAPGSYLVNTALNVTSGVDPTYGITIHRDSITVISEGRRGGTVISLNTGGVGIDLSGSAWTTWKGLFIQQGPSNPSTAAFLMAGTNTFRECLYHTFESNTVQMYLQTYSVTYGAVDFLSVALGLANSRTPVNLATLHLPPVLGSTNAQAVYVRLKGLLTNIDPQGGGRKTLVASGLVDTSVGAQSPASGAIVVGASPSDTFINTTTATSVSGDGKVITLTGANLVLAYNSGPRTISIQAYPTATVANVGSINVWIRNMEIEVSVDGVSQRLNYLSF